LNRKWRALIKRDDGRGSEVSLGGLGKDHLVKGQSGNGSPEPGILLLQLLYALHLVSLQAAVFRPPPCSTGSPIIAKSSR